MLSTCRTLNRLSFNCNLLQCVVLLLSVGVELGITVMNESVIQQGTLRSI